MRRLFGRWFKRKRYDYQKNLALYTDTLLKSQPEAERFSRMIPYLLEKTMGLICASLAIFKPAAGNYSLHSTKADSNQSTIQADSLLVEELKKRKTELFLTEIHKAELEMEIRALEAVLVVPGFDKTEKPAALLNLGSRRSNEQFDRSDIAYLKKYANKIASLSAN
ncbi:hypothetical protein A2311_00670 [candidate division WOR-1 bacterium RIFOXYB2_FULL_48_7]|uniref:GAF domain-containing protein n=1 Tax=candidate division WOR-1 bacterium RIFOXYB2_FULL_48_7 TaxID=1802583 RepID=A0A1F4TRD0_UNCSA|nr:MAG: hypothetical protein A2311_00670 [candidate division WOR-1 bacterium RIFOXYB2_FULL_48_7]